MKNIKNEVSKLYDGVFSAYEYVAEADEKTGIYSPIKREYLHDIPCRISYSRISENKQSRFKGYKSGEVKLFLSPDVNVLEGSFIVVVQNGRTESYYASGAPAFYKGHQEIILKTDNRDNKDNGNNGEEKSENDE